MDHLCLAHAVPASVRTANLGKWFPPWTVTYQTWKDALNPRISGVSTDVLLFSECGHALVHYYRVFTKGISHVSLRGSYLDNIRTFVMQSAAMDRWGQNEVMTQSSPVHGSSTSPRSIRQRDSDKESPCCKTRRARSPHMTDVPAVLMSPTAVSSQDPNAIIYDGRPSILPVSISLADLAEDDVVVTVNLPNVIAPPGENGRESGGSTSARDLEPASLSEFSSDSDNTISGASGARRALGSYFYAGVPGTDPGGILSWDTGCDPDIRFVSRCLVLRPNDVAGDSCTDFGH